MLSQKRLKALLHYDPATGLFARVAVCGQLNQVHVGDVAGYIAANGYRLIRVDSKRHRASHLAWLYMTGEWPIKLIDHRNRNRADDRFDNLREATHSQNAVNSTRGRPSASGFRGVYSTRNRWMAQIRKDSAIHYLGVFDSPEEASAAYELAAKKLHGDFLPS